MPNPKSMKMVPLPKFRTFSVNKPFVEPKIKEAILRYVLSFFSRRRPKKTRRRPTDTQRVRIEKVSCEEEG